MRLPRGSLVVLAVWLAAAGARADEAAEVRRLLRNGDTAAALARAQRAAEAKPSDPAVRFLEGVILLDQQRDAEALQLFRRMTEDFPELAEPYNNIATLEARAGRLDEARAALETALRNDPANTTARANLGEIHLRLAMQAWQAAAAAQPHDLLLQRKLQAAREIANLRR
jgi:Flp pilus assembly protein TadD